MAIGTYSELVTALEGWLNRTDISTKFPDFIALFEARMNRMIRHPSMETDSTSSITTSPVAVPTDFLEVRKVTAGGELVEAMSPQHLDYYYLNAEAGTPKHYALTGGEFHFRPTPSAATTIAIDYYQKIPALTSSAATNWLLTAYPDAYLYGVLRQAFAYLRDPDGLAQAKAGEDEVLAEIEMDAARRRKPSGPLASKVRVYD